MTIQQASEYLSGIAAVEKNDPAVRYEPIDRDAPQEVRFRERLKQARAEARAKADKKEIKESKK